MSNSVTKKGGNPSDPSNIPPMNLSAVFEHAQAKDCLTAMGMTSENVAEKFNVSREKQDQIAVASHAKALEAQKKGLFKSEIVPVTAIVKDADGNEKEVVVDQDEGPKATTMETLAKLKPAFKKGTSFALVGGELTMEQKKKTRRIHHRGECQSSQRWRRGRFVDAKKRGGKVEGTNRGCVPWVQGQRCAPRCNGLVEKRAVAFERITMHASRHWTSVRHSRLVARLRVESVGH